ncbi:MAG: RluA family pseudouridine synthase [Prevotellaceae bacterium]|nr:RluA family pseudouridine synthase [Prevotellaceae bacterium]
MNVLYEDNHLIIVNKAPGEITQGDKTGDEPLGEAVKRYIKERYHKPGNVFLGLVHRLDRPTSGIVVMARTSKALARMNALFRDGGVQKTYHALLCNAPREPQATLEHRLARDERRNKSFVTAAGGQRAVLDYTTLGRTERYTLVEVRLHTGRHHQIRCQLAHIGCPIRGDLKYGAPRSNRDGSISLHARRVRFEHPVSGRIIDVTAPYPPDSLFAVAFGATQPDGTPA